MIALVHINPSYDERHYERSPNQGIKLAWMYRIMHIIPTSEFLFCAEYSEQCHIDSGESQYDVIVYKDIPIEKIIGDGDEKDESPCISRPSPEFK
jgi:hypothetical protein